MPEGHSRPWLWPAIVVLGLAVGGLGAVVLANEGDAPADVPVEDPGLVHLHGLGIDPADGTLYAASHAGLFQIQEPGVAVRAGDSFQDTMGFTVTGPGRFVASGHPDLRDERLHKPGKPPLLGLVESTDAGGSWRSLSLLGDADLHAIALAGDEVLAFDATNERFLASPDGVAWVRRSRVQLVSFAVNPDDAGLVVAGTGSGLLRSEDGGRTWDRVKGGPAVSHLSWDPVGGLWGLTAGGELLESADGLSWNSRGSVPGGRPEALLAQDGTVYAATRSGIHRSADGGVTWDASYRASPP
jgi:hypothetical protein